jgi:hypothetical protein
VPRTLFLTWGIGLAIVVAVGIAFLADGDRPAGLFLLVLRPLFTGLYLALIWASGRRVGSAGEPTGKTLTRMPPGAAPGSAECQARTGGGNVPGNSFGRMNASMPLAVLELAGPRLTLRFRPRAIVAMFGARATTTWQPSDVNGVYPVRGRLPPRAHPDRPGRTALPGLLERALHQAHALLTLRYQGTARSIESNSPVDSLNPANQRMIGGIFDRCWRACS